MGSSRVFDPWGTVAGAAGTPGPSRGFQSDWTDPAGGGVWMGTRWYSPGTGAFTARVVRRTPSWRGQNIRLLSCSTGCPSGRFAQSLADELNVAVRAPTVDFYVNSRGVPVLDPGGSWIMYSPGGG